LLHDRLLYALALLSGSITPSSHRALIQSEHLHNRLHRTAIRKKPDDKENELARLAKSFQHRTGPSSKCPTTERTAIALALTIMDSDGAPIGQTTRHEHVALGQNWRDASIGSVCVCIVTECCQTRPFSSSLPSFHRLGGLYHMHSSPVFVISIIKPGVTLENIIVAFKGIS